MKVRFRMKCSNCGQWNRVPVNKIFIEQHSPEPKVKVMIQIYEPLRTVKCRKCGRIIAEPGELIRIVSLKNVRNDEIPVKESKKPQEPHTCCRKCI